MQRDSYLSHETLNAMPAHPETVASELLCTAMRVAISTKIGDLRSA